MTGLREAEGLLVVLLLGLAVLLLVRTVLGLTLRLLAAVPGAVGRGCLIASDHVTPRLVRRLIATVLASGLGGLAASPALAAVTAAPASARASADPWHLDDPRASDASASRRAGQDPTDRGTARPRPGAPAPEPEPHGPPIPRRTQAVTVRAGDTLWGIAQRHLGPEADDADIAAEWPRWYAANRAAIGPDPHLLLPGTRLSPP